MTIEVTDEDREAAEGLGCITEERHSIVEKAFARHRQAAYHRAANWIDDNFGADECAAFLDAMRG